MEDKSEKTNSEELNELREARKELKEHLKEEYDPRIRMEYQAELDSIEEQINSFNGNDELSELNESKKELEDLLKEEYDPRTRMEYQAELDSINERIDEIYTDDISNSDKENEQEEEQEPEFDEQEQEEEPEAFEDLYQDDDSNNSESQNQDINENIIDDYDSQEQEYFNDVPDMDQQDIDFDEQEMDFDDPNVIDGDYTILDNDENTFQRTARLAKEYTKTQARSVKEKSKNFAIDTASKAKRAILNTPPFRIARGIKKIGKGLFKGFKTAALLTLGVGVISVEAVQNAKHAIERASSFNIRDAVNNGRENANIVLDRLEEKIISQNKQLDEMQNQQTYQIETEGR